tara:strand:+ start:91 stop:417 length:327 start_codon:yes stop_codon:yes gene_type:complete
MAASFQQGLTANAGTTEQTIYTAPAGTHLLIGVIATNIYGSTLGVTVKLVRSATEYYISYDRKVDANITADLLMGTKLSLTTGDEIKVSAPADNAFTVIATVTQDVLT